MQILQISTYYAKRPLDQGPAFGGSHGRDVCYSGNLNPLRVLQSELNGEYDVYNQGIMERRSGRPKGDILISGMMFIFSYSQELTYNYLVAANSCIRDDLRKEVGRLDLPVRLVELEYQPPAAVGGLKAG